MPLAHPTSTISTANFGSPAIAVSFALAKPGETVEDFQLRINSRGEWGQTRYGTVDLSFNEVACIEER